MNELEKRLSEINIEIRQIYDDIMNPEKGTVDEFRAKLADAEKRKISVMQEIAQAKVPLQTEAVAGFSEIVNAMREMSKPRTEYRSLVLNGTGAISQIKQLVKQFEAKTPVLDLVSKYYGAAAGVNIPVLSPALAEPVGQSEGSTAIGTDSTAAISSATLAPKNFATVLPVSANALALNFFNLESELPGIFSDAYARLFHKQILTGSGTGQNMQGIFAAVPAANQIPCASAGGPKIADLVNLALKVADFTDNAALILNPSNYASAMSDATNGYDVYKYEMRMQKTIEGVKIIVTSAAPSAVTANALVAVAGDLSRYALGIASEIMIEPIKVKGDTNTYFQSMLFADGKPVIASDFYALKAVAGEIIRVGA